VSIPAHIRLRLQLEWLREAPNLACASDLAPPEGLFKLDSKPHAEVCLTARRLGLQFEELIRVCLQNNPQVTDLEANIPVRSEKVTLGEADLLLQFSQQWWHLELALKFYLRQPNIDGLAGYFGPNRRDRFDLKWQHMTNHQCNILSHASAKPILEQRNIDRLNRAILIKGWLFQHPDDPRTDEPFPINKHHQRGWWVHQSEVDHWLKEQPANAQYLIVEKPYWLYPLQAIAKPSIDCQQLKRYLAKRVFPTQVWVVLGQGVSRQLISRGYVVSDRWESSDG